jgi:predicted flap endonuclease-1-like 5' DNA nuclease
MNLQQILSNLFSFANSYEAIVFSAILFITLILGVLFTFFLFAAPALRKNRKATSELQSNLEISNSKVKLNEEKYTVQVSKTKRLEEETTKLQVQIEELTLRNNKYQSEIAQLQFEKESLQHNFENSEKEILELKNLYKISLQESSSAADRFALFISEKNELTAKLEDYKNLVEQLEKERQNSDSSSDAIKKLSAEHKAESERLENEKSALKEENINLKLQLNEKDQLYLDTLKQISILKEQQQIAEMTEQELIKSRIEQAQPIAEDKSIILENNYIAPIGELHDEPKNEQYMYEQEASLSEDANDTPLEIENNLSQVTKAIENDTIAGISQLVGQPNEAQADNLKLINGINQEIEEKLFALGINSYEQLSRLNDENINQKLCQKLQLKDKTIENDQWEAQARQLLIKQKINNLTKDINLSKLFKKQ